MRKARLPLTLCFAVLVVACTTTKDLEMHPELVPTGSPKTEEKESALQRAPSSESGQGEAAPRMGSGEKDRRHQRLHRELADAGSANAAQPGEGERRRASCGC